MKSSVFIPINLMSKQKHSPLPLLEYVFLLLCSACSLENAEAVGKGFFRLSNHSLWKTFFQIHGTTAVLYCQKCGTFLLTLPVFSPLPHRKKVLDFYQRACLSGYCSAFAYKPMHCALSSQLNGKCIELVQVPGQSAIFTCCDLPGTTPIKQSSRRNSWSSDGMCVSAAGSDQPRAVGTLLFRVADGNLEGRVSEVDGFSEEVMMWQLVGVFLVKLLKLTEKFFSLWEVCF